jgi:hypothetical protein
MPRSRHASTWLPANNLTHAMNRLEGGALHDQRAAFYIAGVHAQGLMKAAHAQVTVSDCQS